MMKNRKPTTWTLLAFLPFFAAITFAVTAQPPAEVDESSAAVGRVTFRSYCASCHGTEAKGDGPVAEYLTVAPADLTLISDRNDGEFPFEKIYKIVDGRDPVAGHGSSDMPIWGQAFTQTRGGETEEGVEKKINEVVHFLWSIQGE